MIKHLVMLGMAGLCANLAYQSLRKGNAGLLWMSYSRTDNPVGFWILITTFVGLMMAYIYAFVDWLL